MRIRTVMTAILLAFVLTPIAYAAGDKKETARQEIRAMADKTLQELYKVQPQAQKAVNAAAGYAVFSNFGVKVFIAGSGTGSGVVVDRKTKRETFMKMAELQAGLGFSVKKFRLVWVFEKAADLNAFVNSGWELGAQTTTTAQAAGMGGSLYTGAVSIKPGVWLYQLSDDGLALDLTAKGTKYYKDKDLN